MTLALAGLLCLLTILILRIFSAALLGRGLLTLPQGLLQILELFGGLAILAGAFVAIVSVPLMMSMLIAMFTVHLRYGFSAINTIGLTKDGPVFGPPGYEVSLLYIAGLLVLVLGVPGPLSVDRWLARRKETWERSGGSPHAT